MHSIQNHPTALRRQLWLTLAVLTTVLLVSSPASAQLRDRTEKNAIRGMTGEFEGLGMVLWVSREQAELLLPQNPDLRLAYPGEGARYPIVLLLGAQHDVGVQLRRGYIHPRYLKQYENAYVIVPYLKHPALTGYGYTFSRIFVSDERVTEQGAKLNHSPKVHAAIEDDRGRFVVSFNGQRQVDLALVEDPAPSKNQPVSTAGRPDPQATEEMLRAIFKQPKIEFSPNPHVFAFDFMAEAQSISPAQVAGTIVLPAARSVPGAATEVPVLSSDRPVPAIRFSSRWTKALQH